MTAKSALQPAASKPKAPEIQPPSASVPRETVPKYLPIEGAEILAKPYMVAEDASGKNATAAIRKDSRHMENWQWVKGTKWKRLMGGGDLGFTPTHYSELQDGWAMKQ